MAQRREQLLENGMPHQQLDSVLAEFREQPIKAANDTNTVSAMANKHGSVGEDGEAVAIVVASAVAEKYVVGYDDRTCT